ncbi:protein-disulfide reductase DsbD family protein [Tenacibaculum sp. M341]|uniref:protein-disulfide reductase DsbD family protein n=1 Tax=Tenacibaculum sp. M341 TaxID=2530339 RepID=UPI00105406B3|nr:thioredoxin family protein [Tenacibaculum sp. M341]TCI94366.1 thioredoxin family protein [Tenacibaculum sp. M341]
MKKIFFLLIFTFSTLLGFSQIFNPIKWKTNVEKISDTEYFLVTTASIEDTWHLYGQDVPKGGPRPTIFHYTDNENYSLIDKTIEEKGITEFDNTFKMVIKYFEKKTVFKQKIKLLNATAVIKAEVEFMVCNDERCLPPNVKELTFYAPDNKKVESSTTKTVKADLSNEEANKILYGLTTQEIQQPTADINTISGESNTNVQKKNDSSSLFSIFLIAFLSGFAALLTPCVFPMIPMTVSYFTKQSKNRSVGIRNAIIYGISIIAIYVFLGYIITIIFGADSLNRLSTNLWFNVIFFIILVAFAFSFFGFYELTLPSSWSTKIDDQADRSGILGIFFMALALAVVSFSCTGPIVGTLLVEAASTGGLAPVLGMLGFSLAIALPFALFAAFPGWLNSLPKSGGWMNTVKVVLGFLELALAFKFLSNADMVAHWNLLKIEPFLIIWILIFASLALYLFGKIKFPHDSPLQKISGLRITTGVLVAAFAIYLASGFRINEKTNTFTPLSLLSGLAPPVGYSFIHPKECPNNLTCFKDLKEGLAFAKKENKPVMLDFTGYACVNCRKMEEHVWPIKEVDDVLRNDYVLISLYVDDKKELPKEEQLTVTRINGETRTLKTYGNKWSHFQTIFFKTNTQPYYALLNADGTQILNNPVGYTPNSDEYLNWLLDGKKKSENTLDNLFNTSDLLK